MDDERTTPDQCTEGRKHTGAPLPEPSSREPVGQARCSEIANIPGREGPPSSLVIEPFDAAAIERREELCWLEAWFAELRTLHGSAYLPRTASLVEFLRVHETGHRLDTVRNFGHHVRSLRRVRGMTQEALAERCGLSADTIRRLEHGSFSPSLDTLRKLGHGLDLMLSTLFESFELGARNEARELLDLLSTRSGRELDLATRVLRTLFDELDRLGGKLLRPLDEHDENVARTEDGAPDDSDDDDG